MGKVDYTFPLPNKYLHARYDVVFDCFKKSLSATIVGLPLSSRSGYFKFVIESEILADFIDTSKYKFLIFDHKDKKDSELLRFLILELVNAFGIEINENFDPLITQLKIENYIRASKFATKIIIFIPDFDEQLNGKPETVEFIERIWKINKHNVQKSGVLFCFTASDSDIQKSVLNYVFDLNEIVHENIINFDLLNNNELLYTRSRLEFFRNQKITNKTHSLSQKLSGGHYILYKTLTNLNLKDLTKISKTLYHPLLQNILTTIWAGLDKNGQNKIKKIISLLPPKNPTKDVFIEDILPLTAQENEVFEFLKSNQNILLNRDQIGQIMWGKNWIDKYSDWAIDKLISKLKQKLGYSKYKILTFRGQGYKLTKYV